MSYHLQAIQHIDQLLEYSNKGINWTCIISSRAYTALADVVQVHHYWHIRQMIYSTGIGVRVCLLVLWSKNFNSHSPASQNLKFSIVKCDFS